MSNERFSNSFWTPITSTDTFPHYLIGLSALHNKLDSAVIENERILSFFKKRVDIEKKCATLLVEEQQQFSGNNDQDDMFANLQNAFDVVRNESEEAANCHRIRAGIIEQEVIVPLSNFNLSFQRQLTEKRSKVTEDIEIFEHAVQSVLMTRAVYWSRCRTLEMANPDYRPPVPPGFKEEGEDSEDYYFDNDSIRMKGEDGAFVGGRQRSSSVSSELNVDRGGVRLGKRTELPYREVARLMCRMQKMIEPVPSSTPILSSLHPVSKYAGQCIFEWIRDYCAAPVPRKDEQESERTTMDEESMEICQHLVALNFLKPVTTATKGNKHTQFSVNSEYEIQRNVVDRYLRKTRIRRSVDSGQPNDATNVADDADDVESIEVQVPDTTEAPPTSPSFLNTFLHHFKTDSNSNNNKNQTNHGSTTKSHMEMKEADKTYKQKVKSVEKMRKRLEEGIVEYLDEMQNMEVERIDTIRHAFVKLSSTLSDTLALFKDTYNRITLFQETLKPEQDIQYIIEQYRTGPFCPRPLIYENYYYGSATDQLFGVPLEEVAQVYGSYVPPVVTYGLKLIDAALVPVADRETKFNHIWTDILPLKQMNNLCEKLDRVSGPALKSLMQTMDPNELANAIRFYLLELPECLLTSDLYEPIKLLYTSPQDTDSRLISISKLLTTLPSANYHTLRILSNHFYRFLKENAKTNILDKLVTHFGYVLLRPQKTTPLTTHDHHPKRLVRDLFTKYHVIFTNDINRAQKYSATRPSIIADNRFLLPVPEESSNSQPSSPTTSDSSHDNALRRTLKSIMSGGNLMTINTKDIRTGGGGDVDSPGPLIVPHSQIALFGDPDKYEASPRASQEDTPIRNISPNYLSSNETQKLTNDLMLDLEDEDEEDAVEIAEKELDPQKLSPKYGRSRASTKTSMDYINLDPFFSDD